MILYTIGFTKKTARQFFELLKINGVQRVVDIRLHPGGQLAGFTKKDDLRYFLEELLACDYVHLPILAPAEELLKTYRNDHNWQKLELYFEALMDQRGIPAALDRRLFEEKVCSLLCSEATPEHCHRRLVAERLARSWKGVETIHL
jgi:uncharacterized protein (DUF488 family)